MNASAKSLRVDRIKAEAARAYLDRWHPLGSGGVFSVALGVSLGGRLSGVMTLGPPVTNNAGRALGLRQHELAELRKMHLRDVLPPNSESRALAVASRLVRKHWPECKALITYCEGDEAAAAYKGAGWLPLASYRYVSEVRVDGRWYTIRDANRRNVTRAATETRSVHRRKWALPLTEEVRGRIAAIAPSRDASAAAPDPQAPSTIRPARSRSKRADRRPAGDA